MCRVQFTPTGGRLPVFLGASPSTNQGTLDALLSLTIHNSPCAKHVSHSLSVFSEKVNPKHLAHNLVFNKCEQHHGRLILSWLLER